MIEHEETAAGGPPLGVRIDVDELSRQIRLRNGSELTLLDAVSFTLAPGELVAIVGPSGAGKTTLLEAIAGLTPTTSGSVRFDGVDVHANLGIFRSVLGYVPQDDIIHADLPLERTLRYAARLRLPSSASRAEVDGAVSDAMDAVGLRGQADIRVGSLSGGQRKRASIAVELLTQPHVFFLDEPTSGLDPITSAELVARLRQLADRSATVVFTTHSVADLAACNRIVFMAHGGRVGFVGTLDEAFDRFEVSSVADLYGRMATLAEPAPEPEAEARLAAGAAAADTCCRRRCPTRRSTGSCQRAHPVACAHPPHARDDRAQPLDARNPPRLTRAGRRHVRRPLSAGRVRGARPEPEFDGDDRLLGRLRRVLLRAHLRAVADLHRADDPATRTPCRLASRRVRGLEGDCAGAVPSLRGGRNAGCAPRVGPPSRSPAVHLRVDGHQPDAVCAGGAEPRPPGLCHGRERRSSDARACRCCASPPCCSRGPSSR